MKSQSLALLVLISSLFLSLFAATASRELLGVGWVPIEKVDEPNLKKIAELAVDEYNKESNAALKFVSIISGEFLAISGIKYSLIVAAIDGAITKNYRAVVFKEPSLNVQKVVAFTIVN